MSRNFRLPLAVVAIAVLALASIPTRAHALPACTDPGLALYPMPGPFRLLDTATGWAYHPQSSPVQRQQRLLARVASIPASARALLARITLSGYRGEWDGSASGEPSDSSHHPRLRISTGLYPAGSGPDVIRVGSGPARPTEQIVIFPLASDGTVVLNGDSIFDTRIEVVGYYAPPGPGALYFHLLPKTAYLFSALDGTTAMLNTVGRSLNPGESATVQVSGTRSNGAPWYNDPSTYSIPADARYVVGNTLATLRWNFSTPTGLQYVRTHETGTALPQTGIALTTWDGFAEGGQFLSRVSTSGTISVSATANTDICV